ncbi:helix-turn-helix domain-containing protein [Bacillus sp. CGMCC 1.16607]|uniref:helix-turn-helix domain-containing protein n=1 Tax=Bacillus sp. CGMCC 1.16607 TaxID=3351842 RepID=UPI003633F9F0
MKKKEFASFQDLFNNFKTRTGRSNSELAKAINKSTGYISLILRGHKIPSTELVSDFCKEFNEDEQLWIRIREKSLNIREEQKQGKGTTKITKKKNINKSNVIVDNQDKELKNVLQTQNIVPTVSNLFDPNVLALAEKLQSLPNQIREKLMDDVHNVVEQSIDGLLPRINIMEFKETLDKVFNMWKTQCNPSATGSSIDQTLHLEMEGKLELNNGSFLIELVANNSYLSIKTKKHDSDYLNEFLACLPGLHVTFESNGNLGKLLNHIPLYHLVVLNPSSLVNELTAILSKHNSPSESVTVTNFSVNQYLKYA